MGNEQSLPKVFEHVANSSKDSSKYIKTACDLVEFGRVDLSEQLIVPLLKDASLDTVCVFLSEKRVTPEFAKKILDGYQPVEKEKLKVSKHLVSIFRHPEILDKTTITYTIVRDIFETVSEKYEKDNPKDVGGTLMDFAIGIAVGDISRGEIMLHAYEVLSRIPPEFLTRVEEETDFSRFDLAGKMTVPLGKYKDLAPMSDFVQRQVDKIESREARKLLPIEERLDTELYMTE